MKKYDEQYWWKRAGQGTKCNKTNKKYAEAHVNFRIYDGPGQRAEGAEEVAEPHDGIIKELTSQNVIPSGMGGGMQIRNFLLTMRGMWNLLAIGTVPSSTHIESCRRFARGSKR